MLKGIPVSSTLFIWAGLLRIEVMSDQRIMQEGEVLNDCFLVHCIHLNSVEFKKYLHVVCDVGSTHLLKSTQVCMVSMKRKVWAGWSIIPL